jgi:hypothetical protein
VPYVRPPPDSATTAFAATDGLRLYLRGKPPRDLTTDEVDIFGVGSGGDPETARRYAFAIYRVALDGSGVVTASAPSILVEDALFLSFLAGNAAEGLVSRHKPDPSMPNFEYEQEPSLPIRAHFGDPRPSTDSTANDELVARAELPMVLENATQPVLASTRTCMPALTAAGAENPFDGQSTGDLRGARFPAMHAPGDNEFVIDGGALNHMGAWFVMPHQLLLSDAPIAFFRQTFAGHGNPLSMPVLRLAVVEGGGGACTP